MVQRTASMLANSVIMYPAVTSCNVRRYNATGSILSQRSPRGKFHVATMLAFVSSGCAVRRVVVARCQWSCVWYRIEWKVLLIALPGPKQGVESIDSSA